ncbi:MAG: ribosome silencing factor [[Chlorobium] sp. 445]|nr:MAG: ribosome silencing factor [[Chlorobium] sp. 445]
MTRASSQSKRTSSTAKTSSKTRAQGSKTGSRAKTAHLELQPSPAVVEISESERLARRIAEFALSKKGYDITLLDVHTLSDSIDFFVICSADSDRQVKAITDAIYDGLLEEGQKPAHREIREQTWMVLDYITVIVHVFLKERRAFYGLEKLWGDARFIYINSEKDLIPTA